MLLGFNITCCWIDHTYVSTALASTRKIKWFCKVETTCRYCTTVLICMVQTLIYTKCTWIGRPPRNFDGHAVRATLYVHAAIASVKFRTMKISSKGLTGNFAKFTCMSLSHHQHAWTGGGLEYLHVERGIVPQHRNQSGEHTIGDKLWSRGLQMLPSIILYNK